MQRLIKIVGLSLLILLSITGCSKRMGYINTDKELGNKHIVEKNYMLNKQQSTYIGSSMIRVSDYTINKRSTGKMNPTEDFIFNSDSTGNQIAFSKNEIFSISGSWEIENIMYTAITNPRISYNILINEDGSIHNKIVNIVPFGFEAGNGVTVVYTYEHKPTTVRFENIVTEKTEIAKGNLNYELIYTGTDGDSFMITYREYTKDDLARPSFFQNLTYLKTKKQIRFRNLLIEVHSIDNERIVYSVLKDTI
jgi:hypothetical protein